MLTRRVFANCVFCAGAGLLATDAAAQDKPPAAPFVRNILRKTELIGTNYDVLQVEILVQPGGLIARHTHPGTEATVVLAGTTLLKVAGSPDQTIGPNDSFLIPPGVPHMLQNGAAPARFLGTYTVERGKPLSSPS